MKKKLLTISWYLFYTLIIFEIFARIAYAIPSIAPKLSGLDELSWHRKWVDKQKKKNLYYFDDYSPSKGWFSKPNLRNKSPWNGKHLNTNAKGFRGRKEFNYNNPSDKKRIIILGDSFTFGEEVSDNETYSYFLQQRFPNTEVINMGIHGYGHDQMLILLKEEGIKYKPDIVILGFLTEDMSRNILNFRDFAKPKYVLKNNELKLTNSPVPSPEKLLRWDWLRPRLLDIWSYTTYTLMKNNGDKLKKEKQITKYILKDFAETVTSIGATPLFVYLPYSKETMRLEKDLPGEVFLAETCDTLGIEHCFTSRTLFIEKVNQGKQFRTAFHWLVPGHQTVAEAIGNYLIEEDILLLPESEDQAKE